MFESIDDVVESIDLCNSIIEDLKTIRDEWDQEDAQGDEMYRISKHLTQLIQLKMFGAGPIFIVNSNTSSISDYDPRRGVNINLSETER